MAMPSRNILVGLSDQDVCQRVQPHEVQSVLLYIFTSHVLLIKLLLWDSWQIPPKHTDIILSELVCLSLSLYQTDQFDYLLHCL